MNNNITEDYCSFEVSKLLKEKGFECKTLYGFTEDGFELGISRRPLNMNSDKNSISRPTHALAIKWIRENFGIHISIHHWTNQPVNDDIWKDCYQGFVDGDAMDAEIFKTYEEAAEAALLYTLKNLIK